MQAQPNNILSFKEVLKKFSPWVNSKHPSYPLNRYILRRNVSGFPFAEKISKADACSISKKILSTLFKLFPNGYYFKGSELTDKNFHLLFEHLFLANREALSAEGGVFIDLENNIIALIHLEDHLTIFFHDNEFSSEKMFEQITDTDERLGADIPFAFSDTFGFITAVALNIGTGLSKEAMIHAPALNLLNTKIEQSDKVDVHGLDSEKEVLHDLIIAGNRYCLGISEKNISRHVDEVAQKIHALEIEAREQIKKLPPKDLFNTFAKTYGALTFCKGLEFHEAMQMASTVDLGIKLGAFESDSKTFFFDMFFSLRRAHLEAYFSDQDTPIEEKRAQLFKEKIKDLKPIL